ncbi:MAG: hypothetical protein ACE5IJ_10800, partial [Thermoplasmata archaeon]
MSSTPRESGVRKDRKGVGVSLSASSQVGNVIEQAMMDILGHAASTVFFKELERKMDVRPPDIAENKTESFSALLRQVFGRGGDA